MDLVLILTIINSSGILLIAFMSGRVYQRLIVVEHALEKVARIHDRIIQLNGVRECSAKTLERVERLERELIQLRGNFAAAERLAAYKDSREST